MYNYRKYDSTHCSSNSSTLKILQSLPKSKKKTQNHPNSSKINDLRCIFEWQSLYQIIKINWFSWKLKRLKTTLVDEDLTWPRLTEQKPRIRLRSYLALVRSYSDASTGLFVHSSWSCVDHDWRGILPEPSAKERKKNNASKNQQTSKIIKAR